MRKVIFLDFDGVLNTSYYWNHLKIQGKPTRDKYGTLFDPIAVQNLKLLIEETGAEIIVNSSWKDYKAYSFIMEMWIKRKLPGVITDFVPTIDSEAEFSKGREISLWLMKHPEEQINYIIIDDIPEFYLDYQQPFLIQTDEHIGLTKSDVSKAIPLLSS